LFLDCPDGRVLLRTIFAELRQAAGIVANSARPKKINWAGIRRFAGVGNLLVLVLVVLRRHRPPPRRRCSGENDDDDDEDEDEDE
jgi:hypothetical protein